MNEFQRIANDLADQQNWDAKVYRFCPVLSNNMSANMKIFEDYVYSTAELAEDRAKEMIDANYNAGNDKIAKDYAVATFEITVSGAKLLRVSGYTPYA